ncbi:MAG: zf-C2H2 Zinc finger, C2H2 type [Cirrosporium novae-zelandiae]|nr:MAG: zf-C2H2 Zinc finger, C2H2 type [Cirrosporium novae-zelandiae]
MAENGPLESIQGGKAWYYCDPPMNLGEAPIYRASDSTLHWVDCLCEPPELHILKVDPVTGDAIGRARVLKLEDSVTVQFFRKNVPGSYICAYYQGVAFMDEATGKLQILKEIIPTDQRNKLRFNDGGVDAKGRFWLAEIDKKAMAFGPNKLPADYGEPKGRLWRYDPDGSLHQMEKGLVCGNGLAWSPDNRTMYLNDSVAMMVFAYDFDLETGSMSNKRLFIDRRSTFGEPDGMVVDTEGSLWIAVFASNRIMVFSPEGKHLKDIVYSAYNPACTTWGGKDLNILYMASGKDKNPSAKVDDEGGHMFIYKPKDTKGHRLNHRPKKVFSCTKCPKEFVRLDLLQRHLRRHEKGMWFRNIGGVVNAAPETQDEDAASSSKGQTTTPSIKEDDTISPVGTINARQIGGANSLFFDASTEMQDVPTDLGWLFQDTPLQSFENPELLGTINTPSPDLYGSLPPLYFQTPSIIPPSLPTDPWLTARSRLIASLGSLPPSLLESSFFYPQNLSSFYDLYFENYHPHFPILHRPSFSPTDASPFLIASLVTLGSTLAPDVTFFNIAKKIHDQLRWIIFGTGTFEPPAPLWCLQALLLIQAFEKMFSTRKHHELSSIFHSSIITLMRRGSAYTALSPIENDNSTSLEKSWYQWIDNESSRRTAFFAFIMDAQHAAIFGHTPVLSAVDIRLPLPCPDTLWDCPTPDQWEKMNQTTPESPQFLPTLRALLRKIPIPSVCSAFSRFILLHGLFSVITHLQTRDSMTLGVGVGRSPRHSSTSPSIEDWKDILGRAIDTWSFSLLSTTPSLCVEAARPLHRMAHIIMHANLIDFHIVAGAPSLLGSLLSRNDYAKAKSRVRAWSESFEASKTLVHCLFLVRETIFTNRQYRAWEDNIQLRPWSLYHATLILWAYGFMVEGKAEEDSPIVPAEEYLVRMMCSVDRQPTNIKGANQTRGLILAVRDCFEGCRWELVEEAYVTLGRLIGISGHEV